MDTFSGSVGRIPWTAVNEYAKRYPLLDDDFDLFEAYISIMDDAFLELVKSSKPNKPPRAPPETPKPPEGMKGG